MDSTPVKKVSLKETADAVVAFTTLAHKVGKQRAHDAGHKRAVSVATATFKFVNTGLQDIATRDPEKIQETLESVGITNE